jgi:mRNA interferase HigB
MTARRKRGAFDEVVAARLIHPTPCAEARAAVWKDPSAIKRRYRHASFLADNRVIFNIGGNKYRLVAHVNYDFQIVYIKFVGTHAEYDRIDPETI